MGLKTFSDGEVLKFGWNTMKKNLGFFIVIFLISGFFSIFPDLINKITGGENRFAIISINLIFTVFQIVIGIGMLKIALKFCDNETPKVSDLFSCFSLFFNYLAGSILYALIVLGGMILLIVPGIIWSLKFQFFAYLIIDKGMGPVEALKKSAEVTCGAKWDLFGFNILTSVVLIAGILCLLVGYFAAAPTVMVACALVYRKLLVQTETQTAV